MYPVRISFVAVPTLVCVSRATFWHYKASHSSVAMQNDLKFDFLVQGAISACWVSVHATYKYKNFSHSWHFTQSFSACILLMFPSWCRWKSDLSIGTWYSVVTVPLVQCAQNRLILFWDSPGFLDPLSFFLVSVLLFFISFSPVFGPLDLSS